MYSTILRHVLYPIGEKILGTAMLKYLKEVEETQWWSPEQLRDLQNRKLRVLVKHAYENVPYYRRIFEDRCLTYRDIQRVEDLPKLPILTKDIIRQNSDDLKARNFNRWKALPNSTSGSTGEPLKYYITMDVASINWACTYRGWGWAGYRIGDRRATFGGFSLLPDKPQTAVEHFRRLAERNLPLSAVHMDEQKLTLYVQKMIKFRPKFIYGYPSVLYSLASFLKTKKMCDIRPKAIFTTAETLLPRYRQTIEEEFNCQVFDQYGCYDGGAQALECSSHQGYHISAEKVIMEFVDGSGRQVPPGCAGEIIATDLHNYAMPFVRYAVGDVGVLAKDRCPCGRGLPLMESIQGRVIDLITLCSGEKISGLPLTDILEDIEKKREGTFKQYQIVQQSLHKVVVRIVKGDKYSEKDACVVKEEFKRHLGEGMRVEVELVDQIPKTRAGKQRFVLSQVADRQV